MARNFEKKVSLLLGAVMLAATTASMQVKAEAEIRTESEIAAVEEITAETAMIPVTEDMYPSLVEGGFTRDEMEFFLAYGPDSLTGSEFTETLDYVFAFNQLFMGSRYRGDSYLQNQGPDAQWRSGCPLETANRWFSLFTDFRFRAGGPEANYNISVEGDMIWYTPAELSHSAQAYILDAWMTDQEMRITYSYQATSYENPTVLENRTAVLQKNANGRFQIVRLATSEVIDTMEIPGNLLGVTEETAADEEMQTESTELPAENAEETGTETVTTETGTDGAVISMETLRPLYEATLTFIQNQEPGYEFTLASSPIESYEYVLTDLDGDGIKDLMVSGVYPEQAFYVRDTQFFLGKIDGEKGLVQKVPDERVLLSIGVPLEGYGFYNESFSRGTGATAQYFVCVQGNSLVQASEPSYEYTMGDAAGAQFQAENPAPDWKDISDLSGLE